MKPASVFSFIFVLVIFTAFVNASPCHEFSYTNTNYDVSRTRSFTLERAFFDECLLVTASSSPTYKIFPDESGIREIVPHAYRPRYEKWRSELLSTEFGKQLWQQYADNKELTLRIVVTGERKNGAGTDDFKWDGSGKLVGATIFLGKDLDKGFPDPVYYPVMNSLGSLPDNVQAGNILASAKLAHELGHVEQISGMNGDLFQEQNKIITAYYRIFLKNGYKESDPRLEKLVKELGARPIDIWQDREYWSEVSAMKYLVDRLNNAAVYCSFARKMRSNLNNYAESYSSRFELQGKSDAIAPCGL